MYTRIVIAFAKLLQLTVRKLGRGGGSALPGLVAEKLSGRALPLLAKQLDGIIVIAGTNGKTTTSRLLSTYLDSSQRALVHNRTGSNLTRGILSALLADSDWYGRIAGKWGLFEVDEAALPKMLRMISPDYLVALNLFRDQLDRYGEVDSIAARWRTAMSGLSAGTTLVLNADDPNIAFLGEEVEAHITYFGLEYDSGDQEIATYADSRFCPRCAQPLHFDRIHYSHLGYYRCPSCGFARPRPDLTASGITMRGMEGSAFKVRDAESEISVDVRVAGLFNIYNVAAAMAVALSLQIDPEQLALLTRRFEPAFGRLERISLDGVEIVLVLVKNPTGFNQVIQTLETDAEATAFWFVLNDKLADGRDVSWIWDTQLERLAAQTQTALVSGTRAYDMGLRLKYGDFPLSSVHMLPKIGDALRMAASLKHRRVYCLCTYTGMLDARRLLQSRRAVQPYHAN